MIDITASIVIYNNHEEVLELVKIIQKISLNTYLYLIDNSKVEQARLFEQFPNTEYIFAGKNLGYGKGHNLAIEKIHGRSTYHIVLNPDISFEPGIINELKTFMDENQDIGQVMPKVLYPNGDLQKLCKLLPTPMDLIGRRFGKLMNLKPNENYELPNFKYDKIKDIPNLSGCFMFFRTTILEEIKGFDPRYFMYLEDIDLTRRALRISRTVFYPKVSIIHKFRKESSKKIKMLIIHSKSAIQYFNKWGWIRDPERDRINNQVLTNF